MSKEKPPPVFDPVNPALVTSYLKAKDKRAKRRIRDRKKAKEKMATRILQNRKDKIKLIEEKGKSFLDEIDSYIEGERRIYIKNCLERYTLKDLI